MLERHYGTSISTAGAVVVAGAIAVEVGISMIPGAGPAKVGAKKVGQQAAKKTAKAAAREAAKTAAKGAALDTARGGAKRVAALLPAGDQQLQFEITAIFALALADIHGMELDQDQAHALVYGLSNGRVSQQQIATMAVDVATSSEDGVVSTSQRSAVDRGDWSHWASTLADTLPAGAAQNLVRTIKTGQLDTLRAGLSGKQQATVEYGIGALHGGVTRFLFGREVIEASRTAFPTPPDEFPQHLTAPANESSEAGDAEPEPNRALAALQDAARSAGSRLTHAATAVGDGVASSAMAVGTGAATAADAVSRPFRRVDLDGDGVPDEPRALTAVKDVGGTITDATEAVGARVSRVLKSKKQR